MQDMERLSNGTKGKSRIGYSIFSVSTIRIIMLHIGPLVPKGACWSDEVHGNATVLHMMLTADFVIDNLVISLSSIIFKI